MFYLCSFPRSGNTWIRLLLMDLLNAEALDASPVFTSNFKGVASARHEVIPATVLAEQEHRHIVKSHGKWDNCAPGMPIVYLLRDGRDAMYSYYHFNLEHRGYSESWDSYFERHVVQRKMIYPREIYLDSWMGNWSENVNSYLNKDNVLIIQYEQLRQDALFSIKKILQFLNIDFITEDVIKAQLEQSSHQLAAQNKRDSRPRGSVGGWRQTYSAAQNEAFIERHGECLAKLGYEHRQA